MEHRVYGKLAHELIRPAVEKTCICRNICASSTDNYPHEGISFTSDASIKLDQYYEKWKAILFELQVSTNTVVHAINKIHNKVVIMQDKFETTLHEVSIKQTEKQEDVMDGIGIALTEIEKSLTDI